MFRRTRTSIFKNHLANPVDQGRLYGTLYMIGLGTAAFFGCRWFDGSHARNVIADVVLVAMIVAVAFTWLAAAYIRDQVGSPETGNRFKGFQMTLVISMVFLAVLGALAAAYSNGQKFEISGAEASLVIVGFYSAASVVQYWRTSMGAKFSQATSRMVADDQMTSSRG
ncbi:hypothetical protein KBD20_02955 [Candidatus Saccharibacteria bacterium]|nr:hypothetical protein [Candidatus Saccharibacteria bacterium]